MTLDSQQDSQLLVPRKRKQLPNPGTVTPPEKIKEGMSKTPYPTIVKVYYTTIDSCLICRYFQGFRFQETIAVWGREVWERKWKNR